MLGISAYSYDAVTWVTSQFSGSMNTWWLNRIQRATIPESFDSLVEELRKTSLMPNIRDDAMNAMLEITGVT
jgi:cytochrome P450